MTTDIHTTWPARREALVSLFRSQEYGRIPEGWTSSWEKTEERQFPDCRRITYTITLTYQGRSAGFPAVLWLPLEAKGPVPVTVMISNHDAVPAPAPQQDPEMMKKFLPMMEALIGSKEKMQAMMEDMGGSSGNKEKSTLDIFEDRDLGYWPVDALLARGWGAAAFYASDLSPDNREGWNRKGAASIFQICPEEPEQPGCLSLWAFGASRVLDVLLTVPEVDAARISVAGHSRGGKAALWAAAQDDRFETALVNNSGCCGAALNRGKTGESVTSIQTIFPHWFCPNFRAYQNIPVEQMPFDQHQLLGAMAPRPVYVASGSTDYWTDPEAEFAGCKAASPFWEALGLPGLTISEYPEPDTAHPEGMVGYHLRRGGHNLTTWDWMRFCDFEERHA